LPNSNRKPRKNINKNTKKDINIKKTGTRKHRGYDNPKHKEKTSHPANISSKKADFDEGCN
jgi:hypothetical protein